MNLCFLIFTYLTACLAAPGRIEGTDNISHLMAVSIRKPSEIYKEKRDEILSYYRLKFGSAIELKNIEDAYPELTMIIKDICKMMTTKDLVEEMIQENCLPFLIIFWYHHQYSGNLLAFDVGSLKILFSPKILFLTKIFRYFRIYISKAIIKSKPANWKNPSDSQAASELLDTFRIFWDNKLKLLGRMMRHHSYHVWERRINQRLRFLEIFLSKPTEDLLLEEYWKLLPEIQIGIMCITPPIQNFCFLVKHFRRQLGKVCSPHFVSNFEWLASNDKMFIVTLLFFLRQSQLDIYPDAKIYSGTTEIMKSAVEICVQLHEGKIFVFETEITETVGESDKISWLAHRILEKTSLVDKILNPGNEFLVYQQD